MPDWGAIPWVGVLVAVVASQIIGFLWYGPLFGKPWRAGMGIPEEATADRSGLGQSVAVGTVLSVVAAIALAILLSLSDTPDVTSGWKVGLLASAIVGAYILTSMMFEKGNRTVAWINVAHQIVMLAVMGAIIGAMW